jgi:hypothetical protein
MKKNHKEWKSIFPLSSEEKEIDEVNNIKRDPRIGCFISIVGTIIFWSVVYHLVS